jgi:acyl-CoA synthetase (AMP-forming)/AMP-acid ligase II
MAVWLASLLAAGIPALAAARTELPALLDRLPFAALVASEPLVKSVPELAPTAGAERLGRNTFGTELLLVPFTRVRSEPCGFAWTLLTSGSTGEPRAVTISARNLIARTGRDQAVPHLGARPPAEHAALVSRPRLEPAAHQPGRCGRGVAGRSVAALLALGAVHRNDLRQAVAMIRGAGSGQIG